MAATKVLSFVPLLAVGFMLAGFHSPTQDAFIYLFNIRNGTN